MTTPTFRLIEDRLRNFLRTACIELTDNNEAFLTLAFQKPPSDYENLELTHYCRLIFMNVESFQYSHLLFGTHDTEKSLESDASFIAKLRNKYSHLSGRSTVHSDEQLADILIVRRFVRTLSKLCASNGEFDDFLGQLDSHVNELLTQVVQVEMPDKFDNEGQRQILGEADREYIKNAIIDATNLGRIDNDPSLEASEFEKAQLPQILRSELEKFEEKLGAIASIKGRLDGVESALLSRIDELLKTTKEIQEEISSETVDAEFKEQYGYDDETLEEYELEPAELINLEIIRTEPALTKNQARDQLITLRKRIWRETGSSPSADGLLRKSMIDYFLTYLPQTEDEAWNGVMGDHLLSVNQTQLPYLPDVCSILRKVQK